MSDAAPRDAKPMLAARFLGRVRLTVGDRELSDDAWPPRGGHAPLLLLLVTPRHRLARDVILELVWHELSPDPARDACYKALHCLRRVIEPDLPPRSPGSYVDRGQRSRRRGSRALRDRR